jgi:CheY-like chemotaxis protein
MLPLIAVIENSEAMRAMFALIAQGEGWTISGYNYAEMNLATVQQLKPDLIILDLIDQRIGEGWELLQLLKMEESTAAIPIIISTTMSVLPLEIQGYLASRDINVIAKPFAVADFIAIVRQELNGQSALLLSTTKRLPILLVEDNAELSDGFIEVLQLEGYLVAAVPNGQLALDAVRQGRYSLIFLDMNMPVMTGQEFIAAYALEPEPHMPVIIFSAQADFIGGKFPPFVIGRLPKPFGFNELFTFVSQYAVPILNPE